MSENDFDTNDTTPEKRTFKSFFKSRFTRKIIIKLSVVAIIIGFMVLSTAFPVGMGLETFGAHRITLRSQASGKQKSHTQAKQRLSEKWRAV